MVDLVSVENLSIFAGEKPLVKGVSFSLKQGETLCVVGESGSGKSLSSLSIMGLLPDSLSMGGRIVFDGADLAEKTPEERRWLRGAVMSMIFQEPMTSLNPVLTVGEQVAEVFEVHTQMTKSQIDAKVIELFEKVHIKDAARRVNEYPHQLSGGQRQRVMIAMALAMQPKLLIADEPTTALDATVQGEILALIKELQADMDMGVLFVTHDFGVVAEMADNVVVMQNGEIVETGKVEQVMSAPEEDYTKKLLAAMPKMNKDTKKPIEAHEILKINDVKKTFMVKKGGFFSKKQPFDALKGVSIDIKQGETVGLVGESGCGKSTLAKCIMRLYEPDSGEIKFMGHDVAHEKGKALDGLRRNVQMVFQDPFSSLNPRMKIGESVGEGVRAHGLMGAKERREFVESLLEDCGLPADAYDRYPHQFSGGQRQRICIARALALKPAVIIADEPVSALDVAVQKQILELLEDLKDKHKLSYLFISHDLRVISQICDRVLVMHDGEIVESGSVGEVFEKPKHEYTQTLLAAVPGA